MGTRGLALEAGTKPEPRRWRDGLRGAPASAPGASAGHLRRPGATGGFRSVAPHPGAAASPPTPGVAEAAGALLVSSVDRPWPYGWNPAGRPARRLRHPLQPAAYC